MSDESLDQYVDIFYVYVLKLYINFMDDCKTVWSLLIRLCDLVNE